MSSKEIPQNKCEPSEIRTNSPASDEIRTKDAADWIYAGELTAQLGAHAACVVGQHIQRLSSRDDDKEMVAWIAIFNKVGTLLQGSASGARH